jgi:long-chain acyl-CoA synthetase
VARLHRRLQLCFEAAYGLSETHTCDTYMPRTAVRWGTQGVPAPGVSPHHRPRHRHRMPPGEPGEIVLRSPGTFKGYWNKPEATASHAASDGWVHTGDMGRLDADGYLTFMGRFKEMIKVSGYSVFPEEVETMLIKHPAVAQAAVIGVPDATRARWSRPSSCPSPAPG